jgi:hypothetical protein
MDKIFDDIAVFFRSHPAVIGVLVAVVGLFLFLAAILNWNWIFGDVSRANYSLCKIDGLVNLFGRKTARIIVGLFGLVIIFAGLLIVGLSLGR